MADLISTTTRGLFRDLATASTIGIIRTAFQDEGFPPDPDCQYVDSSERRTCAQEYMSSVRWSDYSNVQKALRAMERIVGDFEGGYTEKFWKSLARDGFTYNVETGAIESTTRTFPSQSLSNLTDASAIEAHLDRIQRALPGDPEQVIGSAKELIESTAKVVLNAQKIAYTKDDSIKALINRSQESLGLAASGVASGPDNAASVKRILGGASSVAIGVAELRNTHGTGHGEAARKSGLGERHASLAFNAAFMWCQLMLETLEDPAAPWRKVQKQSA
ncbi:hypothetical protein CH305_17050 [Rhodococcus sp. 15-649-2-2]|uniref:abortive infection family protein n=1 Tax=Rhodococcus sp. 15-649-2-2 TaxID=2023140 RepID=UPI000B9BF614|nr:abortive infection family protein [Rhodococcus sp. 15-649-2-2]OZE78246.1 hypothetical protein CH305_17050 [Rhodococcus sp. 15-649-2-2]